MRRLPQRQKNARYNRILHRARSLTIRLLLLLALFIFRKDKEVGFKEYYVGLGGACVTTVKGWFNKGGNAADGKDEAAATTPETEKETDRAEIQAATETAAQQPEAAANTEQAASENPDDDETAAAVVDSIVVSEDEIEEEAEDEAEIVIDDEPEELKGEIISDGKTVRLTYRRNFIAKLIQSSDENKKYYSAIKNEFKSYGVTSSVAVSGNNFSYKRKPLGKVIIDGETLKLYLALNPAEIESKYNAHDASSVKKYEKTPCFVRVKSEMGLKKALVLIGRVMKAEGIERNPRYVWTDIASIYPYEPLETLIARDYIKVIERQPLDE